MIILKNFVFFVLSFSWAVQEVAPIVNQVLFYESKQSWTSRDFDLFEKVKKEVLHKDRIGQFVETNAEDFVLSRLGAREAELFEMSPIKLKLSESQRSGFVGYSQKEIDTELSQVGLALSLIELKESQLKQKLRFKTWFDLLKRKYQVKIKSTDFKL